jgi:hypothetical protein
MAGLAVLAASVCGAGFTGCREFSVWNKLRFAVRWVFGMGISAPLPQCSSPLFCSDLRIRFRRQLWTCFVNYTAAYRALFMEEPFQTHYCIRLFLLFSKEKAGRIGGTAKRPFPIHRWNSRFYQLLLTPLAYAVNAGLQKPLATSMALSSGLTPGYLGVFWTNFTLLAKTPRDTVKFCRYPEGCGFGGRLRLSCGRARPAVHRRFHAKDGLS